MFCDPCSVIVELASALLELIENSYDFLFAFIADVVRQSALKPCFKETLFSSVTLQRKHKKQYEHSFCVHSTDECNLLRLLTATIAQFGEMCVTFDKVILLGTATGYITSQSLLQNFSAR